MGSLYRGAQICLFVGSLAVLGCAEKDAFRAQLLSPEVTAAISAHVEASMRNATSQPASATVSVSAPAGRDSSSKTITIPVTLSGSAWPLVAVLLGGLGLHLYLGHRAKNSRRKKWAAIVGFAERKKPTARAPHDGMHLN